MMKKVLIIEAQIKRYRKPFYERLHSALCKEGIEFRVVYSEPACSEAQKNDNCELPRDYGVKVKAYWIRKERLVFQLALREIAAANLIVIEQANKFILNHFLLPLSLLKMKKVAFWGLGENLQADRSRFSEWYKERTLDWVHWWFAYTEGTARYLQQHGVSAEKITAVQNSVDTRRIQNCVKNFCPNAKTVLRAKLGITPYAPVGIFVGMLHKVKSIPFLIQAGATIRQSIPEFQLIVVGGGPDEDEIKQAAANRPWVHFVGPQFGDPKAQLLAIADVLLLPGRAGLAVLDGFAAGLPLIATRLPIHGPEMEYLEEGRNGLMTAPYPLAYAQAVIQLLSNPLELQLLREGATISAEKYSIEAMVEKFKQGIGQCLAEPRWQWGGAKRLREQSAPRRSDAWLGQRSHKLAIGRDRIEILTDSPFPARRARLLSQTDRTAMITTSWDDGDPLDLRVAELLAKYGLTGTFYVPRSGQRPVLHDSDIRELSKTFEIGAHTLEHVAIDCLPEGDARVQLSGSREWVEQLTGKDCRVFCFPGGKFRNGQLRLVREAGYQAARTVELLSTRSPQCVDGLWLIPTTVQAFPHGPSVYVKNALKRFSTSVMFRPRRVLLSRDWAALAEEMFLRTMERGGVFHLWGHSWEIAEREQWQALEHFLAFAAANGKGVRCVSNGDLSAEYASSYRKNSAPTAKAVGAEIERPIIATLENEGS
jgi:glycosyltransferase involved in cell wall biosynthesis/peptidoglycan/xylan/chitin deacetylase (PgdA/CDA1 family)